MKLTSLDEKNLNMLLNDLKRSNNISSLSEKYGVSIPQWLTIKYKCMSCAKETSNRIQSINIRQSNKTLTCPFCRKVSQMFTIRVEKEVLKKEDFKL